MQKKTFQLNDGRTLAYAESGVMDGRPLLVIGGSGNGRLFRILDDELLRELHIRQITVDRPGMGASTHQPTRRVVDFADDIAQLMAHLDIQTVAILGVSQGAPFAAACGYRLQNTLSSVSLVSGVAPLTPDILATQSQQIRFTLSLAKRAPFLLGVIYRMTGFFLRLQGGQAIQQTLGMLPESDQQIINNHPEIAQMMADAVVDALQPGVKGAIRDMQVIIEDWGFDIGAVQSKVFMWQGEQDPNVTPEMRQYYQNHLPNCEATFVPDAGHLLIFSHTRPIFEQIIDAY